MAVPRREAVRVISDTIAALDEAQTIPDLRYVESRAAAMYWDAWNGVPMRFASRDRARVPRQWREFDSRRSQLSSSPRKASTPINAILNYLYGIVEAEAHLAALRVGCDPSMGILHSDRPRRVSFACDLMEPVRPEVDAFVLQLLDEQTFLKADFFEDRKGHCRLMPPLAAVLAESAARWAKALAPIAESLAWSFARFQLSAPLRSADGERPPLRLRTPLTQQNRRKQPAKHGSVSSPIDARCKDCGKRLQNPKRTYCDACLPINAQRASLKGVAVQQQLRAVGEDRRQHPEVRAIHSRHATQQHLLNSAWEAAQAVIPSASIYHQQIFPHLTKIPATAIAEATGLSISSAKTIRAGRMAPHPRHWDALRSLIEES